jgi:hypothetical protein
MERDLAEAINISYIVCQADASFSLYVSSWSLSHQNGAYKLKEK